MSHLLNKKVLFCLGALLGTVAMSGLSGCGEGVADPTASVSDALTGHSAGPFGSTLGTMQPSGNHTTPVTEIHAYGTASYVYGFRLFWGTESTLYGQTGGVTADVFDLDGEVFHKVRTVVSGGILRGIKFSTETRTLEVGLTPATAIAFDNTEAAFTDLQVWQGNVNGRPVIWGAKVDYTTP